MNRKLSGDDFSEAVRECAKLLVCAITMYSVMLVVSAVSAGVTNGLIMLVACMVWIGALGAEILLNLNERTEKTDTSWLACSLLLGIITLFHDILCGAVLIGLCILLYIAGKRTAGRTVLWTGTFAAMFIILHLLMTEMMSGKGTVAGMTLILLSVFHFMKYLHLRPCPYGTLELLTDERKKKNTGILIAVNTLESLLCMCFCTVLVSQGMYASAQQKLFVIKDTYVQILEFALVMIGCHILKDMFSHMDMTDLQKKTIPSVCALMITAAANSLFLFSVRNVVAFLSITALLCYGLILVLLYHHGMLNGKRLRIISSVWSLVYMVTVFTACYAFYNGITVDAQTTGCVAGACACIYMMGSDIA